MFCFTLANSKDFITGQVFCISSAGIFRSLGFGILLTQLQIWNLQGEQDPETQGSKYSGGWNTKHLAIDQVENGVLLIFAYIGFQTLVPKQSMPTTHVDGVRKLLKPQQRNITTSMNKPWSCNFDLSLTFIFDTLVWNSLLVVWRHHFMFSVHQYMLGFYFVW